MARAARAKINSFITAVREQKALGVLTDPMSACIDQGNGLTGVVQRLCWILGVQLDLAHNLSLNVPTRKFHRIHFELHISC